MRMLIFSLPITVAMLLVAFIVLICLSIWFKTTYIAVHDARAILPISAIQIIIPTINHVRPNSIAITLLGMNDASTYERIVLPSYQIH